MLQKPDVHFAQKAAVLISQGNANQALSLCADGIAWFPEYASGYLVLAHAYEALGKHADAGVVYQEIERSFRIRVTQSSPITEPLVEHFEVPSIDVLDEQVPESVSTVEILAQPIPAQSQLTVAEPPPPSTAVRVEQPTYHPTPLRLIELGAMPNDTRIIKSSSVRLIPGLEFATLTVQGSTDIHSQTVHGYDVLPEPPAFREFKTKQRTMLPNAVAAAETSEIAKRQVTLEDLAKRLEKARIPRPEETYKQQQNSPQQSVAVPSASVISETIADIFYQQGHYQRALEAYTTLLKSKPDRTKELTNKIFECKRILEAS